jgi:exodeoxyribonuclease VII large subunit
VHAASALLGSRETDVARLASRLDAMSPLKVLGRGYSIVALASGRAVRSSREVAPGDRVTVRVAEGSFSADVVEANERGAS